MKTVLLTVQSLSGIQLFATPWTAAHQASLPITNSQNLLKLMSIKTMITIQISHLLSSTSPPPCGLESEGGGEAPREGGRSS